MRYALNHTLQCQQCTPLVALVLLSVVSLNAHGGGCAVAGGCGSGGGMSSCPSVMVDDACPAPSLPTSLMPVLPAPTRPLTLGHSNIQTFMPPATAQVRVGVIDSGFIVDHPSLQGSIEATHIASGATNIEEPGGRHVWHGTPVALIIAQHSAHERLLLSRASGRNGSPFFTPSDLLASTLWANAQGSRVNNYSLGHAYVAVLAEDRARHASNFASDVVSVMSGGNDNVNISALLTTGPGLAVTSIFEHTDWWRNALLVGAIDAAGNKQDYSNFPGERASIRERFLVAHTPVAYDVRLTTAGSVVADQMFGTSAAAPVVSIAALTVRAKWPHLSAPQVTNILLETANRTFNPLYQRSDCGAARNVNCGSYNFGQGKLDLFRALQPIGELNLATGASVTQSVPLAHTRLRLSAAFGDATPAGIQTAAFDAYGRDFPLKVAPLMQAITAPNTDEMHRAFLAQIGTREVQHLELRNEGALHLRLNFADSLGTGANRPNLAHVDLTLGSYRFSLASAERSSGQRLPSLRADLPALLSFVNNAHIQTFDSAQALGVALRFTPVVEVYAQFERARMYAERILGPTRNAQSAVQHSLGVNLEPFSGTRLSLGLDTVLERAGVHGAAGAGALSLTASTARAWNVRFAQDMGGGWSSFGMLRSGSLTLHGDHLLSGMSDAHTSELALGARWQGTLHGRKTRIKLALAQPLRVDSARAHFAVTTGRTLDGRVVREQVSTTLNPSARQINLELGVRHDLGRRSQISLSAVHERNPGHNAYAPSRTFVGASYTLFW